MAMSQLGNGLIDAKQYEDALSVMEAELSMGQRLGDDEGDLLIVKGNLSNTYQRLGRSEEALRMRRDVYSRRLRLNGEEHETTFSAAGNYASSLVDLQRFEKAKSLLRRTIPVAQRVLGYSNESTLRMRKVDARALYEDPNATLDDVREAVTTLVEIERTARRVFGSAHPLTTGIGEDLQIARAWLLTMRRNYARALYLAAGATLDDVREAVTTLEEIERIARRVFGGEHLLTKDIERDLRNARAALRARETPPAGDTAEEGN